MDFEERKKVLLQKNELPLSLKGLSVTLKIPETEIAQIFRRECDLYKDIRIRKASGGFRQLAKPAGTVKVLQDYLLRNFFSDPVFNHSKSFAFTAGKSSVGAVEEHRGSSWLIKVDLKDFFHSIDENMISGALQRSLLNPYKSEILSRLTTRATARYRKWLPLKYSTSKDKRHTSKKPSTGINRLGYLPQGAATSGAVSNLVAFDLDVRLERFARKHGLSYSRYADDIAISGKEPISRNSYKWLLTEIFKRIRRERFSENPDKTRIYGPGQPSKYLGLEIFNGRIRVPRQYKKYVEDNLRGIEKFGLLEHTLHKNFDSPIQLFNHLHGKLSWAYSTSYASEHPDLTLEWNWANSQKDRLHFIQDSYPDLFDS